MSHSPFPFIGRQGQQIPVVRRFRYNFVNKYFMTAAVIRLKNRYIQFTHFFSVAVYCSHQQSTLVCIIFLTEKVNLIKAEYRLIFTAGEIKIYQYCFLRLDFIAKWLHLLYFPSFVELTVINSTVFISAAVSFKIDKDF
jgi:hypothetical protein